MDVKSGLDGSLNDGVADNLPLLDDVLALHFSRRGGATTRQVAGDSCHDLMYWKRVPKNDSIASTIPFGGCHDLDVLKCKRGFCRSGSYLSIPPNLYLFLRTVLCEDKPFPSSGGLTLRVLVLVGQPFTSQLTQLATERCRMTN